MDIYKITFTVFIVIQFWFFLGAIAVLNNKIDAIRKIESQLPDILNKQIEINQLNYTAVNNLYSVLYKSGKAFNSASMMKNINDIIDALKQSTESHEDPNKQS